MNSKPDIPSVSIVNSDIQASDPSCHVCGAIMTWFRKDILGWPEGWNCLSCGATTGCS